MNSLGYSPRLDSREGRGHRRLSTRLGTTLSVSKGRQEQLELRQQTLEHRQVELEGRQERLELRQGALEVEQIDLGENQKALVTEVRLVTACLPA